MSRTKMAFVSVAGVAFILAIAVQAFAQQTGGGPGKSLTPEEQQKMMESFYVQSVKMLKDALGATDDEWKVLEPKLVDLAKAKTELQYTVGMPQFLGKPEYKLPSENIPDGKKTDLEKKAEALRKLLAVKDAKADDIKDALTAYREAREKAKKNLEKAKKDVGDLLTVRQEATMVLSGQFD